MNLTKQELEAQLKKLNEELVKNYTEKLATEIADLKKEYETKLPEEVEKGIEKYKASLPHSNPLSTPDIEMGHDGMGEASKKKDFGNWLYTIQKDITLPIPVQYSPFISPLPGNYGQLQNCFRAGDLSSDVLSISRSVSGGTQAWVGKTAKIYPSATGTVSAYTLNVNMSINSTVVNLYDFQRESSGYDFVAFAQKETNRILPLAEDVQIFTGSGSPFTGLYNDPYAQFVNSGVAGAIGASTVSISSLRAMMGLIDPVYRTPDLKWYVDMTEEQLIQGLADANNRILDLTSPVIKMLGSEVVCLSQGVLNGTSTTTHLSKHFVLANLKEAVHYADRGLVVEAQRTTGNCTDYIFSRAQAIGVAQPKAYAIYRSITG